MEPWRSKKAVALSGIAGYFTVFRPEEAESEDQGRSEKRAAEMGG
jgi:hypothetical protein